MILKDKVALVSRSREKTARVADELGSTRPDSVIGLAFDLSSETQAERAVDNVLSRFGRLYRSAR